MDREPLLVFHSSEGLILIYIFVSGLLAALYEAFQESGTTWIPVETLLRKSIPVCLGFRRIFNDLVSSSRRTGPNTR